MFGFVGGLLWALKETDVTGCLVPVLIGLGAAALTGFVAMALGNWFWLR